MDPFQRTAQEIGNTILNEQNNTISAVSSPIGSNPPIFLGENRTNIRDKQGKIFCVSVSSRNLRYRGDPSQAIQQFHTSAEEILKSSPQQSPTSVSREEIEIMKLQDETMSLEDEKINLEIHRNEYVRCRYVDMVKIAQEGFTTKGRGFVSIFHSCGKVNTGIYFNSYRTIKDMEQTDRIDVENIFPGLVQCVKAYDATKEFILFFNSENKYAISLEVYKSHITLEAPASMIAKECNATTFNNPTIYESDTETEDVFQCDATSVIPISGSRSEKSNLPVDASNNNNNAEVSTIINKKRKRDDDETTPSPHPPSAAPGAPKKNKKGSNTIISVKRNLFPLIPSSPPPTGRNLGH